MGEPSVQSKTKLRRKFIATRISTLLNELRLQRPGEAKAVSAQCNVD
jgi:hypothetical protein